MGDLLMLLSQFPAFAYNCFMGGIWMFSAFACDLYCIFGAITGMGSLWSHVFITYDRYNVIVHGMNGKPLTFGKAYGFVTFIWVYATAVSTPPLWGWGRFLLVRLPDEGLQQQVLWYLPVRVLLLHPPRNHPLRLLLHRQGCRRPRGRYEGTSQKDERSQPQIWN